ESSSQVSRFKKASSSWSAEFGNAHESHQFIPNELESVNFNAAYDNAKNDLFKQELNEDIKFEAIWDRHQQFYKESSEWTKEFSYYTQKSDDLRSDSAQTAVAAGSLLSILDAQDSKIKNSKFVNFVKKIQNGDLIVLENEVVQKTPESK
ncbi:hypothetical protein ROZALSC1DRAFT_23234, partial [Rozella allomycis CSF55]